jgi:hypothetical protein
MEITTTRDKGDLPRNATYKSKSLFTLSKKIKKSLGLHYHETPSRVVMNAVREYRVPEKVDGWFCTVFINGNRYCGVLAKDICVMGILREVKEDMAKGKMLQIRIDDRLHKWFKTFARDHDSSMTDIVISYIEHLKRKSDKSVEVKQI